MHRNYIFRLQDEADNNILGWGDSNFDQTMIDQIPDPESADTNKQITSIPSPFARINLVETAFKEVLKSKDLSANTRFHRIVSDTLDVAQIFFEYDKIKGLEVIEWNKDVNLKELQESTNPKLKRLGKTLDTYLKSDQNANNFGFMDSIYILCYRGKGVNCESFIGATSPKTLFFSSANDYSGLSEVISFGNDKPFDNDLCPLYKRDLEFVKSLYAFRASFRNDNGSFADLFPEINDYMNECKKLLSDSDRHIIDQVEQQNLYESNYTAIPVGDNQGNCVRILGNYFRKRKNDTSRIAEVSDFVIKSNVSDHKPLPLVLPVNKLTGHYKYTDNSIYWDPQTKVPDIDEESDINKRILPSSGVNYPYLTLGDFFEDRIIKLQENINYAYFFDGRREEDLKREEDFGCYLLPFKDLLFNYFTVDELIGDGLITVSPNNTGTCVTVTLKIPVRGGCIQYSKNYFNCDQVIEVGNDVDLFLLPGIKDASIKRAALVLPKNARTQDYVLTCYDGENLLSEVTEVVRNSNGGRNLIGKIYVIDKVDADHFRLQVKGGCSGLVIPRKRAQREGNDKFTFAIDFGTTNTHIEYKVNERIPEEFTINEDDLQLLHLTKNLNTEVVSFYESDLIPEKIGTSDSQYGFPTRTVLSYEKNTKWNTPVLPMANANIPYSYEKQKSLPYNTLITGLKWSNDDCIKEQVRCYIENLFILLRNKVLLNNGSVKETKIVWFYPVSMNRGRIDTFSDIWKGAYEKYFGENVKENLIQMTESLAPYKHFITDREVLSDVVTIDIGGGTTDVVIAPKKGEELITSFRFAADSIFGDPYSVDGRNGIVERYKEKFEVLINANEKIKNHSDLVDILDSLYEDKQHPENVASFLFSLENNSGVKKARANDLLSFNQKLKTDERNKFVFLLFYTAIMYHVAKIMKTKDLKMPRTIAFSGNGSKIIDIITDDKCRLGDLTKAIFVKIYNKEYDRNGLDIKHEEGHPKAATCKGGVKNPVRELPKDMKDKIIVYRGFGDCGFVTDDCYGSYIDNLNDFKSKTAEEAKNFFDFFFALSDDFGFRAEFSVNAECIELAKEVCYKDLETYAEKGLEIVKNESGFNKTDGVAETSFFYPIQGAMSALIEEINK